MTQKIIALASYKGGVGKTTSAIHLAQQFAITTQQRVALVDSDLNESALAWGEMAMHKKFDILNQSQPIEAYDWVFVDSQARPDRELMAALASGADLILIPSETSATPLRVTAATAFDLPPDCKNYRVFFNKVPSKPTPRGRAAMAREALIALGIPVLKSSIAVRPAIPTAESTSQTLTDSRPRSVALARQDYQALAEEILELLK